MTVERRSSLRKAPTADVVDALTTGTQETSAKHTEQRTEPTTPTPQANAGDTRVALPARRPKRRMLPFSSKIEMNLRDEMDEYLAANNITIIDFLDEAIRDRLNR